VASQQPGEIAGVAPLVVILGGGHRRTVDRGRRTPTTPQTSPSGADSRRAACATCARRRSRTELAAAAERLPLLGHALDETRNRLQAVVWRGGGRAGGGSAGSSARPRARAWPPPIAVNPEGPRSRAATCRRPPSPSPAPTPTALHPPAPSCLDRQDRSSVGAQAVISDRPGGALFAARPRCSIGHPASALSALDW
jgi:hypothetical protein